MAPDEDEFRRASTQRICRRGALPGREACNNLPGRFIIGSAVKDGILHLLPDDDLDEPSLVIDCVRTAPPKFKILNGPKATVGLSCSRVVFPA